MSVDEYVKKSAVIDWFRPYGHTDEPIPFETLVSDLRDSIPPADVAAVVRCMQCRHSLGDARYHGELFCHMTQSTVPYDGFCFRGERQVNGVREG